MKTKSVLSLLVGAALTLSLSGCGGSGNNSDSSASDQASSAPVRVWFMEGSVSDAAQTYLKSEFEKENPGQKISIEIQPWKNIKAKLQTSLASDKQSPDIAEIGTGLDPFVAAGAFIDISNMYDELGGKDLIPAFTKGGTYKGKHYAYPMYGGVRGVFYRKDLLQKAGLKVPQTLTELKDTVIKLQAANPDKTPNFSGMYLAGADFHALESYLYAMGGSYAEQENGKWVSQLNAAPAQKALQQMQEIFRNGTHYALDSQAGQKQFQNYFNSGKVGMLIATGNIGQKIDKKLWDADKVGVMALPSDTPGEIGATYAGGSNLAISKNGINKEGAKKALKIIFSKDFMNLLAKDGWVPGNLKYADNVSGAFGPISKEVMEKAKGGPLTLKFATFFANNGLQNFWAKIAKLENPETTAKEFGEEIDKTLNSGN